LKLNKLICNVILLVTALLSITVKAEANIDSTQTEDAKQGPWQGFYVAGSYGFVKDSSNLSSTFTYSGGGLQTSTNPINMTKSTPGILFGYNHQIESYILGIEADINPVKMSQGHCARVTSEGPDCGDWYYGGLNLASKTEYKGAVKLRLGYQLNDFMMYANSGLAYVSASNTLNINCPAGCTASDDVAITSTSTVSKNSLRFTYGVGGEYMINENWRLGLDYSYFTFPDLSQVIIHQATYGPEVITSKSSDAYSQLKLRAIYSF
jgi:opacity protein-like surface antigen